MESSPLVSRSAPILIAVLLVIAFAAIQILIGGTRLLFAFPSYVVIGGAGILALLTIRADSPQPDRICLISAAAFCVYVGLRALSSPVDYIARADLYSGIACLVVYFLSASVVTSAKMRLAILLCMIALSLAHIGIGALQFRDGNNFMPIAFLQRFDYQRRASGFYICPNHLAGLLEILGAFGLSITCWSRLPPWGKLLTGYATAMIYAGETLTGSRGGFLSVIASSLVFAALSAFILRAAGKELAWRISLPAILAAALIALVAAVCVSKSDFLTGRAQNLFDKQDMRVDLWQGALQQWKLRPWLGTGSATYLYYGRQFRTERMQLDPVFTHNDYLQLLAEYGLVGAALFLVFLASHVRAGWKNFRRLGPKRIARSSQLLSNALALNVGALVAVAALTVHSFFDFNMHIPANALLMAFVLGSLANSGVHRQTESNRPHWLRSSAIFSSAALGLTLIIQAWRLLPGEYFTERARAALRDYDAPTTIIYARKGLEYEVSNPDLYVYLGRARMQLAEAMRDSVARDSFYNLAIPTFEQALALAPMDERIVLELALAYDGLRRCDDAEQLYQRALTMDPRSVSLHKYYEGHADCWPPKPIEPPSDHK